MADSSLRTYVDVVSAASIASNMRMSGLRPAISHAVQHILDFFPGAQHFLRTDGQQGHAKSRGRIMGGAVGGPLGAYPRRVSGPETSEDEGGNAGPGFETSGASAGRGHGRGKASGTLRGRGGGRR